ncbi:uncharacterized protein LOC131622633 [Vicia villosa]|uniref:uncharacterized protein LOC131622633 n=1 Tax=Vicia villosa TaxID=3911 RepID=UPI00273BB376|nr:uncharacterized protein LOC131622633 [Vicia villosa]
MQTEVESVASEEDDPSDKATKANEEVKIHETLTEPMKDPKERKLCVDVLSDNWNPMKGRAIKYVAPKMVNGEVEVEIEKEDIESEIRFWENSMILYVLEGDLSMNMLKNYMIKTWNYVKLPNMYFHDDGYFLLRFNSFEDRDEVMMKEPYSIRNMPMILKEWRPDFDLKKDLLRTLPIWIKLPKLPLHLWGEHSLKK